MEKTPPYGKDFPVSAPAALTRAVLPLILMIGLAFAAGCGGSGTDSPLASIAESLKDQPTFSIVLDDMREEGTFFSTFYHSYLVVLPERSNKTDWIQVSESFYDKNRDFLGMALMTKKDGEVEDQPSPPGYRYVGDERYGRWREDGHGGSFWEFYGKYAFFTSLFGGWYHPINRYDYPGYSQHRSQGRPFFGSNKEYGSQGNITKTKRPDFFERRMSGVSTSKSSFSQKVNSKIGRTSTSARSRGGGSGK